MLVKEGEAVALLDIARVSYFRDLEKGDSWNLHLGDEDEDGKVEERDLQIWKKEKKKKKKVSYKRKNKNKLKSSEQIDECQIKNIITIRRGIWKAL